MSIRQFRPMTAGTRFRSVSGFDEITRDTPEKSLVEPLPEERGRNNQGHVTLRRRGGGHKRQYRRSTSSATSSASRRAWPRSSTIRTGRANIALLVYADGEKRYILHPKGLAG
jgi:large subunit ribosomal protein L2